MILLIQKEFHKAEFRFVLWASLAKEDVLSFEGSNSDIIC